jgi:hypothetical protein
MAESGLPRFQVIPPNHNQKEWNVPEITMKNLAVVQSCSGAVVQ